MVSILDHKDQEFTDFCLGCVISSIAEEYVGEACEECYSFAAGKKTSGQALNVYGIPPKAALLGAIRYGVLPKKHSPYGIASKDRDFLANWENWKDLEGFAAKPFKSFKKISINQIEEYLKTTTILAGIYWQEGWSDNAIITMDNQENWNKLGPHEVRIIGINEKYFIIQNSRGLSGDNGVYYLPREAYNMINHTYVLSPKPWSNLLVKLIAIYL